MPTSNGKNRIGSKAPSGLGDLKHVSLDFDTWYVTEAQTGNSYDIEYSDYEPPESLQSRKSVVGSNLW